MRRKNTTSKMMKGYITGALLLLMKKRNFSEISIGEITDKAGVNRSTYYRNFHSKEEIIETFFCNILEQAITELPADDNLTLQEYLVHVFKVFYSYKDNILCIHQNKLSHLLLSALNSYFLVSTDTVNESFIERLPLYYHTGGGFLTILYCGLIVTWNQPRKFLQKSLLKSVYPMQDLFYCTLKILRQIPFALK